MTDKEYEQAMVDEGQRSRLTFDIEVRAMIKEAVEMEREECAKVCENGTFLHAFSPEAVYSRACARAIRARGQSEVS
jgi:hypothetical protein